MSRGAMLAYGALFLIACVLPLVLSPFHLRVAQTVYFGAALALSWTIIGGFAGYFSFGHAVFVGMGAFTAGIVQTSFAWPHPLVGVAVGLVAAVALVAAFASAIAYPILRLRGVYFAIAMLGTSLVVAEVSRSFDIFQGAMGIVFPQVVPRSIRPEVFFYYAFLLLAALALVVAAWVRYSRIGFGLIAIREDEDTAKMLGVPVERCKIIAFVTSAMLVAVAGVIYAYSLGYITAASVFRVDFSLNMIVYSMLGGLGTIAGPIIGATFMTVVTRILLGDLLEIHMLVTGFVVVLLVLVAPGGVLGVVNLYRPHRSGRLPHFTGAPAPQPPAQRAEEAAIALDNVTVRFRGLVAVEDVTLALRHGEISSLIGPNGAGKSTLFNVITGYIVPSEGRVTYRGKRIDGTDTAKINRGGIARAFQIAKPFHGLTVAENVGIGVLYGRDGTRDTEAVVEETLALTGLTELRERVASELTVGNLRRLELARAIATRPDLLLADEPCAGLNHTETDGILDILRTMRERGGTVLLVEHDMSAVMRVSDRVFVLDAGKVIAEGSPREVTSNPRVIEAYLGEPLEEDGALR